MNSFYENFRENAPLLVDAAKTSKLPFVSKAKFVFKKSFEEEKLEKLNQVLADSASSPADLEISFGANYKCGQTLNQTALERLAKMVQEDDRDSLSEFNKRTVNELSTGILQRIEVSVVDKVLNTDRNTWVADCVVDIEKTSPFATKIVETVGDRKFTRLDVSSSVVNRILAGLDDTEEVKSKLSEIYGVKEVNIYNQTYWTKNSNGEKTKQSIFPLNVLLFSKDVESSVEFRFKRPFENIVDLVQGTETSFKDGSVYAYYTSSPAKNPPDLTAWAVVNGYVEVTNPENFFVVAF